MNSKVRDNNRVILAIFAILSLFAVALTITVTAGLDRASVNRIRLFDEGWVDSSGNTWDIKDVRVEDEGISPTVGKKLPDDLKDGDCLCFETYNIDITVSVDGRKIYSFETKENITGRGYGTAYHEVGLGSSLAGKTVEIVFSRSNMNLGTKRGHVEDMYLGEAVAYVHLIIKNNIFAIISSVLVVFFGITFLLISFVISDNERLPFDVAALGLTCIFTGTWLLILTNVYQLITGQLYVIRVLNRFLVMFTGVPMICFFNSLTRKKRRIYPLIEFWVSVIMVAALLILRYAAGIDMMTSFQRILIVYFAAIIILSLTMFIEHEKLCKANGVSSGLKFYYLGIAAFIICALVDYGLYFYKKLFGNAYGTLTSIGVFILVPVILIQFIRWWTKDRQVVERERFTNNALQYALSSESPDEISA